MSDKIGLDISLDASDLRWPNVDTWEIDALHDILGVSSGQTNRDNSFGKMTG